MSIPLVSVYVTASTPIGMSLDTLISTLQSYVDDYMVPAWGTPAKIVKSTSGPVDGAWNIELAETSDVFGALGYHDFYGGYPFAKVFVADSVQNNVTVSSVVTHELAEMLVDPTADLWVKGPGGVYWALEVADPCEALSFNLNGVDCSDFVYPSWFKLELPPLGTVFDVNNIGNEPYYGYIDGYAIVMTIYGDINDISFGRQAKPKNVSKATFLHSLVEAKTKSDKAKKGPPMHWVKTLKGSEDLSGQVAAIKFVPAGKVAGVEVFKIIQKS